MTKPEIGPIGIWTAQLDQLPAARAEEQAARFEELGYGALWLPEVMMREALTASMLYLQGTTTLVVATGVANMWGRDPHTMSMAHKTISEAFPGRFVLGIGVSHQPVVEGMRGHEYKAPYTAMRHYLETMDAAPYAAAQPAEPPVRVLAALGPKMLRLAAEKADGAHPYLVTPDHTAMAREIMGPDAWLAPEHKVILETDTAKAREIARGFIGPYTTLPNYRNNLLRIGFAEEDFVGTPSDRLVDGLVAHGSVEDVKSRVEEHLAAGADHVCVQVLPKDGMRGIPVAEWEELAPALVDR